MEVQLDLNELDVARAKVRAATEGLDPEVALFVAFSAFVGQRFDHEVALSDPATGKVAAFITPPRLRHLRTATSRTAHNNQPTTQISSLKEVVERLACASDEHMSKKVTRSKTG